MAVRSELGPLSIALRYLALSDAFLDSALRLCTVLKQSPRKFNYARGSVVQYLVFHAIELFLKGAILEKEPTEKLINHDIQALSKRYRNLYKAKKYEFDAPFLAKEPSGDDLIKFYGSTDLVEKHKSFRKESKKKNPQDQLLRYPANVEGQEWTREDGFEPVSFLLVLRKLKGDLGQLSKLIFPDNNLLRAEHLKDVRR